MDTRTLVTSHVLSGNVTVGKVDTKTLVVGQDVYMFSGCYVTTGRVIKVTPSGVDVQTTDEIWRFDTDGKACDSRGTGMFKSSPWERGGIPGTYECGPWELDDIPFAKRTAFLERRWADWQRKLDEAKKSEANPCTIRSFLGSNLMKNRHCAH
jgi:hypothetical protein